MTDALDNAAAAPDDEPHEGGFRAHIAVTDERGGARYGEFSEQVRQLMDNVRYACPDDALVDQLIDELTSINARLAKMRIDEWHSPAGTRIDLPSRGNITLPPYKVIEVQDMGVVTELVFRDFHLGGNNAAHGGHIAVAFDDIGGYASAVAVEHVSRTAYLNVQYRSITPLNTPLRVHAWAEKVDGRKVFVKGTMHDGDRLCAEMDGLFIKLNPGQQ